MSFRGVSRRRALAWLAAAPGTARAETAPAPEGAAPPALGGRAKPERRRARPGGAERWLSLPPTPSLPKPIPTDTVAVNGTRLWYAQYGAGEPVLFLHGGFGHSAFWGHQVASLATRFRVIVIDTRGHGRSPLVSKTFGFRTFADDVDGLLGQLGIGKTAIVGWSDGAITGLQLAMTKPERVKRLFAFGANTDPSGLISGGSRKPPFAAYVARCKQDYARLSPDPARWPDLAAGLGAMWRREPNYPSASLSRIAAPTTVAFAPYDEIIRPEHAASIAKAIPGAKLVKLDDVSHFAMLQDPAGFTKTVEAFLA